MTSAMEAQGLGFRVQFVSQEVAVYQRVWAVSGLGYIGLTGFSEFSVGYR